MNFDKFKHSLSLALIAGMLVTSSCQKKVLDLQPYGSFSDATAFTTPERARLAVNGAYDAAQSGFYLGGAVRGYPFGAATIEQGDMRGEDMHNQALFYQITYEATYNTVTANNDFHFQTLYSLINKVNLTLEGLESASAAGILPSDEATQLAGEMYFLRALAHHELVIFFARPYSDGNGSAQGIIYRDFGINSEAKADEARAQQRTTVADNYTKILADLDRAETQITSGTGAVRTYRASKAAAIALKMRVKMHMGDWAGVIAEGNKIISGNLATGYSSPIGAWKLTPTVEGPFANNQSDENVFSIKNDPTDNGSVNGAMAAMYGDPAISGRGLVTVSPIIYSDARWLCGDARRTLLTRANATGSIVYTTKYRDITNRSDAAPQIRYAEVLLMQAEAKARTGATAEALDLLNAVRTRAVGADNAFTAGDFANADELVGAILFERRVEFLAEGKRWGDIHRLAKDPAHAPIPGGGIPAKVGSGVNAAAAMKCDGTATFTRAVPAIPYDDFRFIWPIPLSEIQQNENYAQNPGY